MIILVVADFGLVAMLQLSASIMLIRRAVYLVVCRGTISPVYERLDADAFETLLFFPEFSDFARVFAVLGGAVVRVNVREVGVIFPFMAA